MAKELKIKIFDKGTVVQTLQCCLNEGYVPAALKQVWELRDQKSIDNTQYTTRTLFYRGDIRIATMEELRKIERTYRDGGCLLFLNGGCLGLVGSLGLSYYGHVVGVAPEAQSNTPELEQRVN